MNAYGIIMAGGGGTRFWPLSRQSLPKQLLNLSGGGLMINETIGRVERIFNKQDIFIVTHVDQSAKIFEAAEDHVLYKNILKEPAARNTAACIGYAAVEIIKRYGDGIMCIFPADHFIKDTASFVEVMKAAIEMAETSDKLITIGITPDFPSTGYGYIHYETSGHAAEKVIKFVEKPDLKTAEEYVKSGRYVWNSGMFAWRASTILKNIERFLPQVYKCLDEISSYIGTEKENEAAAQIYPEIPSISIDYGVLERSQDILVVPAGFGWSDVGSWDMLGSLYQPDGSGNIIRGEHIQIETKECILYSAGRLIAAAGINNLIVVETKDAVLVCSRSHAQDVKDIVERLKKEGRTEYI